MDISGREAMELAIVVDQMVVNPKYYTEGEKEPRLTRAHKWVKEGRVHDLGDGTYTVDGSKPGTSYTLQGNHCTCEHAQKGRSRLCYHSVSVVLYQEWQRRLRPLSQPMTTPPQHPPVEASSVPEVSRDTVAATPETLDATTSLPDALNEPQDTLPQETTMDTPSTTDFPEPTPEPTPGPLMQVPPPTLGREYLITIKGKEFVQYAGLLALAHASGLQSLTARFVSLTPEVALAEATATFADGRSFSEAADATPGNVSPGVKAHYARVALTRAKARCLRDALNVGEIAVEELESEAPQEERPRPTPVPSLPPREEIVALLKRLGFPGGTRDAYLQVVLERTGLALMPDNYPKIIAALTQQLGASAA